MWKLRPVLARNHGCCTLHYSNIIPLLPVTMAATAIHDIFFCLWDVLFAATGFHNKIIRCSKKYCCLAKFVLFVERLRSWISNNENSFFLLYLLLKKIPLQEFHWLFNNINLSLSLCNRAEKWLIILAVGRVARTHKSLIYNI